jgi:predicted enzyme related to lactoylglutathione lyase
MLDKSALVTFVTVKKMERAVKFYTESLGGKLVAKGKDEMEGSWASVKIGKAEFWLVVPEAWEERELAYNAFVVDDIKTAVADLRSRGVKFSRAEKMTPDTRIEGPISHHDWGSEAFFKDSEGNQLMLWQSA